MKTLTQGKYIVEEGAFTASRTWEKYNDGMIFFNKDGLYYYVYANMTDFANSEEIECFDDEEEAFEFLQSYKI